MSRARDSLKKHKRAQPEPDPGLLRKVICGTCGYETGEVSLDPVGTCAGCATVASYSSLDGVPLDGVPLGTGVYENLDEAAHDEDDEYLEEDL